MIQIHYTASMGWPTALGVGRRPKMRTHSSITSRQCIIGLASCARNVLAAHPLLKKPFTTMATRPVNPQGREAPMSYPLWHNHQQEVMRSISLKQEPGWRTQGRFWHTSDCLIGDNPHPIGIPRRRTRWRRCLLPTWHIPSPWSSCTQCYVRQCSPLCIIATYFFIWGFVL